MAENNIQTTEVAIVGGGPIGLTLALLLDMYGVKSTLFNSEAESRWLPKGNTHNQRTMEHFRRLGVADDIRKLGFPGDHPLDIAFFTRLNSFEIARFMFPSKDDRLAIRQEGPATDQIVEPMVRVNQMYVERFLLERARTRPSITIRFGHEVTGFAQDAEGVTLNAGSSSGAAEQWCAKYIVGCDGGRSFVRRTLGIKFGQEEASTGVFMKGQFVSVHMRIPTLYSDVMKDRKAWAYFTINADTRAVIMSLSGTDEFMMQQPQKPNEKLDPQTAIRWVQRAIGADVPVEILGVGTWNAGNYIVADSFQHNRAFLAGDAAHLFTPTGGFGLNTGIDDAANLSWKLAAAVKGWAGPQLLGTYESERRHVAIRNTDAARTIGKAWHDVDVPSAVENDSPEGQRARHAVAKSSFVANHHWTLTEERDWLGVILGARYDGSPIVVTDESSPPDTIQTYAPSHVPGGRAPHVWIGSDPKSRVSLYDLFGHGFTLLMSSANAGADISAIQREAERRSLPLKIVSVDVRDLHGMYPYRLTLIRPDQHIAWTGNQLPENFAGLLDRVTGFTSKSASDPT
jgi:2-polyprenyl-6-methoxyphenol hydroxylase-like FAD-dependent oxidoreductase